MDFEQVEDSIIEALKEKLPHLRTVETYAGQLEDEIGKLPVRLPAAYVVFSGSRFEPVDGSNYEETPEFSVLIAASNPRGGRALRKGASGDYGAYDLVKGVLSALANRTFDLDMGRLRPMRASLVFMAGEMAVYGIDFQTSFDSTYNR